MKNALLHSPRINATLPLKCHSLKKGVNSAYKSYNRFFPFPAIGAVERQLISLKWSGNPESVKLSPGEHFYVVRTS